jgi:flavodoxin
MKALVLYESMFGNTRRIAESIAQGLGEFAGIRTVCVASLDGERCCYGWWRVRSL